MTTLYRNIAGVGRVAMSPEEAAGFEDSRKPAPIRAEAVKADAERRILAIAEEWKQRNMIARGVELLEKGKENLNEEEQREAAANLAIWARIKAIRAASDKIEAMKPIPRNFRDLDIWPE